jgi:hypothetical protein
VTPKLRVVLATQPFERVEAEVAVATFFESDRPLRGAAGRADWRLCGLLSALLEQGRLAGSPSDALLVPTGGRLRSPLLLAVGLGSSQGFGAGQVSAAARAALTRVLDLGLRSASLGIPGEWIGAVPARPAAEALARGALQVLAERGGSFDLGLLVSEPAAGRALRGLEAAGAAARAAGVELRLPDLAPETIRRAPSDLDPSGPVSPAHERV